MSNHFHLLVEVGEIPLSTRSCNRFCFNTLAILIGGMVGHLFQGRYRGILCDRDVYLLGLVRYIHLNPVRRKHVSEILAGAR